MKFGPNPWRSKVVLISICGGRRKVEVYADGSMRYADENHSVVGSVLSIEPLPTPQEIVADSQFEPDEINKHSFEVVWESAVSKRRD
ncbi:DUF6881 domain-containing protein [Burkholderia ubonensis]|uniref:DUF6881 domain-containing protein n=1 Tax=Burkholderia ubonensis TaxID=101571 RepID=UPI0034E94F61